MGTLEGIYVGICVGIRLGNFDGLVVGVYDGVKVGCIVGWNGSAPWLVGANGADWL